MENGKILKNFKLSSTACRKLEQASKRLGMSQTAVVELLIRSQAGKLLPKIQPEQKGA